MTTFQSTSYYGKIDLVSFGTAKLLEFSYKKLDHIL